MARTRFCVSVKTQKKSQTNAERCRKYRQKAMESETFRKSEQLRKKLARQNRSEEQIAHDRELARKRMERKRIRDKEENKKKPKKSTKNEKATCTRKQTAVQRKKWREAQTKYRSNLSSQKKRRIREKDKLCHQKRRQEAKQKIKDDDKSPYNTPAAARKAISRANKSLPQNPFKFNAVLHGLVKLATKTPEKRKLIHDAGIILTPKKKDRIHFLETTMTTFAEYYQKLKLSRKAKDTKQRRVLGNHIARMRKYRKTCCKELGVRVGTLQKWSQINVDAPPSRRADALTSDQQRDIQDFYLKPYVSFTHSGKKAVIKRLQKQRHTMTRSLRSAYEIYLRENQETKISFSKFTQLRPKYVQTQDKGKFLTCLCEKCVNIEFKLKAINAVSDTNVLHLPNKYDAVKATLCTYPEGSMPLLKCAKRQCDTCGTKLLQRKLQDLPSSTQVTWLKWTSAKVEDEKSGEEKNRKVLEKNEGQLGHLTEKFISEMEDFSFHLYSATWQHKQYCQMREAPADGQVIAVLDFAENYTCHFQDECQSAHWCKRQVTIHPVVCTYQKDQKIVTHEVVFVSDDLKHDAHLVHAITGQTVEILKKDNIQVEKMIQFTDGCASQYKSRIPFIDLSHSKEDFGVEVERNFFASGHGKGPADGCSGVIKSAVTRAVKSGAAVIRSAEEFYAHCKHNLQKDSDSFKRSIHMIASVDINRDRPDRKQATTVKGTRKIHSIRALGPGVIQTRELSCACNFCQTASSGKSCTHLDTVECSWNTATISKAVAGQPKKVVTKAKKRKALPKPTENKRRREEDLPEPMEIQSSELILPNSGADEENPIFEDPTTPPVDQAFPPVEEQIQSGDVEAILDLFPELLGSMDDDSIVSSALTGQFVEVSIPCGKKFKTFVGLVEEVENGGARIKYMASFTKDGEKLFYWPSVEDRSTEPEGNIVRVLGTPILDNVLSCTRTQYFKFE